MKELENTKESVKLTTSNQSYSPQITSKATATTTIDNVSIGECQKTKKTDINNMSMTSA